MPEAVTEPHFRRDAQPRASTVNRVRTVWRASLLVAALGAVRPCTAQLPPAPLPLSNVEDARTLPRGTLALRAMNVWTRIDEVFDAAADSAHHLHALGEAFSASALGTREFPVLAPLEAALRTLTGDPKLSLNLGQQSATVDTRIVTTPFTLEYGVTDHLTIGVMVPIVQTQSDVFVQLNPLGTNTANVGPNPATFNNATAISKNIALVNSLDAAHSALDTYLANCAQSGSCSSQNVAAATDALAKTASYSSAVKVLYGTDQSTAGLFAPLGAVEQQVETQLTSLQSTVNGVLGSSFTFGPPGQANAQAALLQLRQLATANPGAAYDSLGSPSRIGVGDVEIGARLKLLDSFGDTTPGMRLRATIRGVLRLPTGQTSDGTVPYETGTGTGQTSADGGAVVDLRVSRRFMATVAGQYTAYFTSANIPRLPNSDYALFPLDVPIVGTWREGNAIQLEAIPRYQLTDYFSISGAYAMRHQAASQYTSPNVTAPPVFNSSTEQRVGGGFSYSTLARYATGRSSVPIEVFYTHLETITASGGLTPKSFRDQIEVRIYYRLFRRGR